MVQSDLQILLYEWISQGSLWYLKKKKAISYLSFDIAIMFVCKMQTLVSSWLAQHYT